MDKVLHMVGGEDEASYAKNSFQQRLVMRKVMPILVKGIEELLRDLEYLPNCFRVSDLGCSSGPNAFLTAKSIIESIDRACQVSTEIQYFLNDLVSNDFNLVFKGLPRFYEKLAKESDTRSFRSTCLISAMPGSFYGKLFPDKSMHFQHSSYCLHWLSQVPSGLVVESGTPKNKGSIYCSDTAPGTVHQAYLDQFCQDFSKFLSMRSQELVQNGQLLLTFLCKPEEKVQSFHTLSLLGMALIDMVAEGHIREDKLDSFNMPYYEPSVQETKQLIGNDGTFKINRIHTFKTRVGGSCISPCAEAKARFVAKHIRAVYGPILATHFGEDLSMNHLFSRFANKLLDALRLDQTGFLNNLVISLTRK